MRNHDLDARVEARSGAAAANGAAAVGRKRRKRWPWGVEEKMRIARESFASVETVTAVAERHGIPCARRAPRPLVEDLGVWLRRQRARVSPKSRLGEKLAYIGNHWDGLSVFLNDGRVELDNNVENATRPLALKRKNALFASHDKGAAAWARIATLIETAKMSGVNPHAHLKVTLEAIANGHPASQIDQLLPWAFSQSQAESQVVPTLRLQNALVLESSKVRQQGVQ